MYRVRTPFRPPFLYWAKCENMRLEVSWECKMNVISHLDPILQCVAWGCKKSRFLATWARFWMDEWFKSCHKISFLWCLSSFERTKKKNVCMNNPFLGTEAYAFIFLKNWTFKKGGRKGVRPLWEQLWHLKVKLTQKIGIKSVVGTPDVYCKCM